MTREEFLKVQFKYVGHLALEGEHQSSYHNEHYGFDMVVVTRMNHDGMEPGRSRKWFFYKGKWYGQLTKFLEAIKDVEYIENV